jgi:excinuclease ABC subunit C
MKSVSQHIEARLESLPIKAGCYIMRDKDGKVIYVGKAINLRNRVRSYFHSSAQNNMKTSRLVSHIADIEWIVVGSELEALILEMNLIKKYRPHYNVRLKDDKRYPYVKVHWADPYPKVTVTRQMLQDGSRYFGPYTRPWMFCAESSLTLPVIARSPGKTSVPAYITISSCARLPASAPSIKNNTAR